MAESVRKIEFAEKTAKWLECAICTDILSMPKTLRCEHSFCQCCIAKLIESKLLNKEGEMNGAVDEEIKIKCPSCNNEDPFTSVSDMKAQRMISNLAEAYYEKDVAASKQVCNEPDCQSTATFKCCRCRQVYCRNCYEHQGDKHCQKQHDDIVKLTQCKVKHFFTALHHFDDSLCKIHSLALDLFCSECKEPICLDCFLISHRNHTVKLLESGKDTLLHLVDTVKSLEMNNRERFGELSQIAQQHEKYLEGCKQGILKKVDDLEGRLHALIAVLAKKAKDYYSNIYGVKMGIIENVKCSSERPCIDISQIDLSCLSELELTCLIPDFNNLFKNMNYDDGYFDELNKKLNKCYKHLNLELDVNEKAIFDVVLHSFDHLELSPQASGKFLPHSIRFEEYLTGKFSDSSDPKSGKERIVYSRELLLQFQHYSKAPKLHDDLEFLVRRPPNWRLTEPHDRMRRAVSAQDLNVGKKPIKYSPPQPLQWGRGAASPVTGSREFYRLVSVPVHPFDEENRYRTNIVKFQN